MKKVYLLVSGLLLTAGAVNAQVTTERAYMPIQKSGESSRMIGLSSDDRAPGDDIVTDDFADASNWTTTALTGDANWEIVSTTPTDVADYADVMASSTADNGFGLFNGVQYLLAGTVTPQDAVLEYNDVIDCSGVTAVTLEFEQMYRAFNSDQTFIEVSNNGGASYDFVYEINASIPTNDPTTQGVVLQDITAAAAGESDVKIRFRWSELGGDPAFGSGYAWAIDDFRVFEAWDYDQEITASYHRSGLGVFNENGMEYYFIPENQITEISFAGKTQNLGGLVQAGAKLNVEVTGAGSYSGVSPMVDLPVGASDSLVCATTFTPSAVGTYDVVYYVDGDNAEEETVNDTIYDSFTVTSDADFNIYSRDNGTGGSSIGNVTSNTGAPLLIGNVMDIFADDVIGAVDVVVSADETNVGQLIFAQVMILDEGSGTFVYAGQTDDHEITAGENGGPIKLAFGEDDHIEVAAGQSILVLAGHYGGGDEVRFRMAQGVDEQTVLGFTSGATEPFFLSSPSALMVRPNMMSFVGIDEVAENNFSIDQNMPNPVTDNAVINYELNEAAEVSVQFVDVSGKVVKTINNGTQQAGAHTIAIDGNDFAEGVYFYTFTVGNSKVTKRMVVTK